MDPSSLQHHHQEITESRSLDSMLVSTKAQNQGGQQQQQQEKKPRPAEQALKCPRCESTNTKFCYYNNYSLSQPRYFCKSCRRYWTKGGTLRNVPVGGGCRKNRRSSSSSATSSSSSLSSSRRISTTPDHHHNHLINHPSSSPSPLISPYDHHHHDLTLAFARLQKQVNGSMGLDHHHHHHDESHGNIGSLLGSNAHFDLFGNTFLHDPQNHGLQQLYYGLDVENGVHHDDHHHHHHQQQQQHQMGMPNEQQNQEMLSNPSSGCSTPTGIKQELGSGVVENRTGGVNLWGLPWQLSSGGGGGDNQGNYINNVGGGGTNGGGNDHQIDTLRESWNSSVLIGSSWHNSLLNSALM